MKCYLLFLLLLVHSNPAFAQEAVNIPVDFMAKTLEKTEVLYLQDKKTITLEDILTSVYQEQFKVLPKNNHSFGINDDAFWLKIKLQKDSGNSLDTYNLELAYPLLDSVQLFYQTKEGLWQTETTGDAIPFSSRKIKHRNFVFALTLQGHDVQSFYIRIRSKGSLVIPLILHQPSTLRESQAKEDILYGIFYGALFIMGMYNLFIFFVLKDRNYFLYTLVIVCNLIFQANFSGHSIQYLWGDHISWSNTAVLFFTHLLFTANLTFSTSFLRVEKHQPVLYYAALLLIALNIIFSFFVFISDYNFMVRFTLPIVSLSTLVIILSGIWTWAKGSQYARLFVIAWAFYVTGGVLQQLKHYGVLSSSFWTENSTLLGSSLEVIFLSFALADKIIYYRKNVKLAQKKLLDKSIENARLIEEQNDLLESEVEKRTHQLQLANEEVKVANESLQKVLDTVEVQRDNILSSINYAQRIQRASLPAERQFRKLLPESFVLFKPRDVVSGDFYFIRKIEGKIILSAIDCTGHGVPGAFMTFIVHTGLSDISVFHKMTAPNKILYWLHKGVQYTLQQKRTGNSDGMDMALVTIDEENKKMMYAGARNPLVYIQNGEMHQIKGDKISIGGMQKEKERIFTSHEIDISTPTSFYLFSDGYQDQFGGEKGKKFMSKRFRNLLFDIHQKPMQEQREVLDQKIREWMEVGNEEQIDDILVIGVKV